MVGAVISVLVHGGALAGISYLVGSKSDVKPSRQIIYVGELTTYAHPRPPGANPGEEM